MSSSLPAHPSLEHLKKSAKQLLAAQRQGAVQCCRFLRGLHRFADATDEEILAASMKLAEAQLVVAMHFGFRSWADLKHDIESRPTEDDHSLHAVERRSREEIPEYAGAGVPLCVVAALNRAGVDMDFMDFAAASGWAFSFGYRYDDVSPAHMAIRGDPASDGPFEVFAFLPLQLGFDYEMALTRDDPDALWSFVQGQVDAGIAVMSEHMDGGLIIAYREKSGRRQFFFDGTVMPGWLDADSLQPHAVYSLVKRRDAASAGEIRRLALERAVAKGSPHEWRGIPQGAAALRSYLADVSDATRDFAETEEWFCWATFERLMARRCVEVWLRRSAEHVDRNARTHVLAAADGYGEAFRCYDRYLSAVRGPRPHAQSLRERARTPERIAVIAEVLEQGIDAETAGLGALARAVTVPGCSTTETRP